MNAVTDIWSQILTTHHRCGQALPEQARYDFAALAAKLGTKPDRIFHFVYVVENFDPNELSVAAYRQRDPFDSPQVVQGKPYFLQSNQIMGMIKHRKHSW